jgi:hypothetical protein
MIAFLIFTGFVLGFFAAALVFAAAALSARREIPPMPKTIRVYRKCRETDRELVDQLLSASPNHLAELRKHLK